jgi:hypothetical protein
MSAHDNYQTPLASRYASSGEYPAIPAPHRLISDCLTLAILETQVLILGTCTEMRELFSARKRGSTWRQLWLWLAEAEKEYLYHHPYFPIPELWQMPLGLILASTCRVMHYPKGNLLR